MNTQIKPDGTVRGGIFTGVVLAGFSGLAYGYLGPLTSMIVIKVVLLIGAVVLSAFVFQLVRTALPLRLLMAVIAGIVGVIALWFGWFWGEFGLDSALGFIQSGPENIYKRMYTLSFQYTYAFGDSGQELDTGRWMTLAVWGGETVVMFFAPILAAIQHRDPKPRAQNQYGG